MPGPRAVMHRRHILGPVMQMNDALEPEFHAVIPRSRFSYAHEPRRTGEVAHPPFNPYLSKRVEGTPFVAW